MFTSVSLKLFFFIRVLIKKKNFYSDGVKS